MSILEEKDLWAKTFRDGWLAKLQKTGKVYWDSYLRPKNRVPISGKGLDLKLSRLMFISSAGGYLAESQKAFDASNLLGDYTIRKFSASTPFQDIAYAHEHYDQTAVKDDPQVLMPLGYLREMVKAGVIGELASVVNFMGYQPDVSQLLDHTIPKILDVARAEKVDAALLVPA